jgi:hypothetical protein
VLFWPKSIRTHVTDSPGRVFKKLNPECVVRPVVALPVRWNPAYRTVGMDANVRTAPAGNCRQRSYPLR